MSLSSGCHSQPPWVDPYVNSFITERNITNKINLLIFFKKESHYE